MRALLPCKKHVLVCCNERPKDHPTPSCKNVKGEDIFFDLKKYVQEHGLVGQVVVTRTRCLGYCNTIGTTIVIQPENIWLTEVTIEDVKKIKEIIIK